MNVRSTRKTPRLAVFAVVGYLLLSMTPNVSAQVVNIVEDQVSPAPVASPETSASPTTNTVPSPLPENDQLIQLREKYKTELSIYRTDEQEFNIARAQYLQLQTLASLETSVKATRKVMLSRTAVLQTYLQMLKLMLSSTSGIDVEEKNKLLQDLDSGIERLITHQKMVEQAVDRSAILNSVIDFNTFNAAVTNVSYKTLSYIAYGRLQTVYDKTLTVKAEVLQHVEAQEQNGLKLGEKRRALDETDRSLAATKTSLDNVRKTFLPRQTGQEQKFDTNSYGQTVALLSTIYADLYRNVAFLREVIKP